jgi:hypothetical protein
MYQKFVQPFVRAATPPAVQDMVRRMQPLRLQYEMFSNANPFAALLETAAQQSREDRRAASSDNPFIKAQEAASKGIVSALDAWRDMMERMSESAFLSLYGSPVLQAAVGIDPASTEPLRKASKSTLHLHLVEGRIAELKARIPEGSIREATIRALIYVGMVRSSLDERGFESIRRIRRELKDSTPLPIADFKALVRDQHSMLLIDQSAALAAIPSMLPPDPEKRRQALELIKRVLASRGALPPEGEKRLQEITVLFVADEGKPPARIVNLKSNQSLRENVPGRS